MNNLIKISDKVRCYVALFLMLLCVSGAMAQMDSCLFERDYHIQAADEGALMLEVDNVSFFKDNEWDNRVSSGYTLPGFWLQPKVTYNPCENIRLEAGLNALVYAGAVKYPNTTYQDLPEWKGDQYTKGAHLNPYFRAALKLKSMHIILGDIYGGANHHLMDPLYSSELNLTSDPEMGLQILIDRKRWHLDLWANWQSFIYKKDYHNEAFTFGLTSEAMLSSGKSKLQISLPVNVVAQHRGGEIDTIYTAGTNTLLNAGVGLRVRHNTRNSWLDSWLLEADAVGYYQHTGHLFTKSKGWGLYLKGEMALRCGLEARLGYMHIKDFVSLLSYPYYGCTCVSDLYYRNTYSNPKMLTSRVDWTKTFKKHYAFGARVESFVYLTGGGMTTPEGGYIGQHNTLNISLGVFIRANPVFLLKKFTY